MTGVIRRTVRHRRPQRTNSEANRPQPVTPIFIEQAASGGSDIFLTFDGPVSVNGLPAITTDLPGVTLVSATQTSAQQVTLTFSANVESATQLNVPYRDPAIRNSSGGYVTARLALISNV